MEFINRKSILEYADEDKMEKLYKTFMVYIKLFFK